MHCAYCRSEWLLGERANAIVCCRDVVQPAPLPESRKLATAVNSVLADPLARGIVRKDNE